ncbi:MAG: phosphoenolpyruvate mutase [Myxococcales bacterium]|nr:phosphoenolpyruvate mutase [Myxococcales bacterium]
MKRTTKLRQMLMGNDTAVLMEAHNGLSAKLVKEAGFEGIWGSGLSISAALGVRDNNEASWTQVLDVLEFMSDATDLPILLDGDTGYGNFNNVIRLVKKLEQRGIAGVCLEDKLFPKTNSFISGEKQALAEVDEFCGKLRAAKDTQADEDFMVVARTEAFIAGWGLNEALLRATAYAESGADVILVHSARKDSSEILSFMQHWSGAAPVIIVPTKYPTEPMSKFVEAGITNFIFANQCIRTVVTALQDTLKKLRETHDLMSVENDIAPVSEIFRLQGMKEFASLEARYLPEPTQAPYRALVLAATKGNFGKLVEDKPKCMLNLKGKPVLTWHTEAFNKQGIKNIGVVRGYKKDAVNLAGLSYFDNDDYGTTGELYSLYQARDFLKGEVVIAYGDVIYDPFILQNLLAQSQGVTLAADAGFRIRPRVDDKRDLVKTEGTRTPLGGECTLQAIGAIEPDAASGEWIGLLALQGDAAAKVVAALEAMAQDEPEALRSASLVDLLNRLIAAGEKVNVVHTFGHWRDLDEQADLLASDQVS